MLLFLLTLAFIPASSLAGELKAYSGGSSCELKKYSDKQWIDAQEDDVPDGSYVTTPSKNLPDALLFRHGGAAYRASSDCFTSLKRTPKKKVERTVIMGSIHGFASLVKGTQANGFTLEGDGFRTVTGTMSAKPGYRARLAFGKSEDLLFFLQYTRWDAEQAYERYISNGNTMDLFPGTLFSVNQSFVLGGMFTVKYLPWDWIRTYAEVGVGYFHFDGDFRLPFPYALKASGSTFEFTFGTGALIPLGIQGLYLDLNVDFSYADVSEFTVDEADFSVLVGEKLEYRKTDFQRFGVNLGLRLEF